MKIIMDSVMRSVVVVLTVICCGGIRTARAQEGAAGADFPYIIPVELGTSGFAPGDRITITGLRGNRTHLEPDGTYLVQGSYTLASVDSVLLLFSCTTRGSSSPTTNIGRQQVDIKRGSGTFSLMHPPCDGWYHVSFYAANEDHSHGGIYFGEKGFEKTILRDMDWPDFSNRTVAAPDGQAPGVGGNGDSPLAHDSNRAIMAYLGHPVLAPAVLDAKYTPTNLLAAFTDLSQKGGWRINKLSVDDSEFPFLVYGVLTGEQHLGRNEIHEANGYDYGGSVVKTREGSTYFALNMIPNDQIPSEQMAACNRRLMIRLQMLAAAAEQSQ